ncbi:MAG: sulfatase-like hydrolase/transferase, partial [Akkermansiaceae bacterium]
MRIFLIITLLFLPQLIDCGAQEFPQKQPNILFCIADDWGWPHSDLYGDQVVKTPHFNRIANSGILFEHAYISAPSCTPSRNAILTGQYHWQLGGGANLWSAYPEGHVSFPRHLEKHGYFIGSYR